MRTARKPLCLVKLRYGAPFPSLRGVNGHSNAGAERAAGGTRRRKTPRTLGAHRSTVLPFAPLFFLYLLLPTRQQTRQRRRLPLLNNYLNATLRRAIACQRATFCLSGAPQLRDIAG